MARTHCRKCGAGITGSSGRCYRCLFGLGLEHAGPGPERPAASAPVSPVREGRDTDGASGPGRDPGKHVPVALENGARFGPYEVIAPLGAGGMGEVYLAEDARLDRRVALKIVRDELARQQDHLKRFEREARLLASLSHPNIAALYGLEESAGVRALVLELIEGPTLHERIGGRPMRPLEAARIARQIAEALESAHARGILHRDLKPGNIKISPDGAVKVLDFGLAKMLGPESSYANTGEIPTVGQATQPGVILGTAPYMSPEQVRGEPLDLRTDIWAFGCVLYEMLTGRAAFSGRTSTDVAAAILEREPDWSRLPRGIPAGLARLLKRALQKDPRRRLQHIGDARAELEEIQEGRGEPEVGVIPVRRRFSFLVVSLWLLPLVVLTLLLWWSNAPTVPPRQPQRLTIVLPDDMELAGSALALSPDGKTLFFPARSLKEDQKTGPPRLYARRLDSFEPEAVPGTDGLFELALSPDGKWGATSLPVGVDKDVRDLARFALAGGSSPVRIAAWPEGGNITSAWLPDGTLVFTTLGPLTLHKIAVDGKRQPAVVVPGVADEGDSPWTWLGDSLPDGRHLFLYDDDLQGAMNLLLLDAATGESRIVLPNAYPAHLLASDILLFSRRQTLLAVRFDPDRLETVGAPVAVQDDLPADVVLRYAQFAVAGNGTVAWAVEAPDPGNFEIRILSRDGEVSAWDEQKRIYHALVLSPDGKLIAAGVFGMRGYLEEPPMIGKVDGPGLGRPGKGPEQGDCYSPAFSPDGKLLAYRCILGVGEGSSGGVYLRSAGGEGIAEKILDLTDNAITLSSTIVFSADASRMLIRRRTLGPAPWLLLPLPPAAADAEELDVFLPGEVDARDLQFSADGTFIVYWSSREGVPSVFARPVSPDGGIGEELRLSPRSGRQPRLRTGPAGRGQEVVYITEDPGPGSPRLMSVRVQSGGRLTVSEPRAITGGSVEEMRLFGPRYAVLPDGQVIFVQSPPELEGPDRIQVILDFDVEVRRRLAEMEGDGLLPLR